MENIIVALRVPTYERKPEHFHGHLVSDLAMLLLRFVENVSSAGSSFILQFKVKKTRPTSHYFLFRFYYLNYSSVFQCHPEKSEVCPVK